MLNKISTGKKKAAITIEVTLSVALSILVLFLALGLFSDNLATMAANSGLQNLFNKSQKTTYSTQTVNPTKTAINVNELSQENVQVVASQGITLAEYLEQAQKTIDKYKATPPTDQAQMEDLARAELAKLIGTGSSSLTSEDINLCINNKIAVKYLPSTETYKAITNNGTAKTLTVEYNSDQINSIRSALNTSNTFQ